MDEKIDVVVLDEDVVGLFDGVGSGVKIFCGEGVLDIYLNNMKSFSKVIEYIFLILCD